MKTTKTKVVNLTLTLFIDQRGRVLFGYKTRKVCRDCWVAPGGHPTKSEMKRLKGDGLVCAAIRESSEETGLFSENDIKLAGTVFVTVKDKGTRRKIFVFLTENWIGQLTPDRKEFKELRFFPFERIPWCQMLPGDPEWIQLMLQRKLRVDAKIICGRDRRDFQSMNIKLSPL